MANTPKRHDMQSVGGRLKYYREKAGYTQQRLAEEIYTTRQLLALWEKNERSSYTPYLDAICKVLNIDEGTLLKGVSVENQTVADDLGLSNDSIEFLKSLKGNNYIPFLTTVTTDSDELDATSIGDYPFNEDQSKIVVDIEGGYPDEMLYIINLLLSTSNGKMLLAMLYKFISVDFNEAYVNDKPCYDLEYNTNNDKKNTYIPVSLMRYAVLQAINSKLEDLRIDAKGDEQ